MLVVPNRAISHQGQNDVVKVLKSGASETRTVKTGLSDTQNTEVADGLREGEQVAVPRATSNTPTSGQGGQGFFFFRGR